MRRVLFVLAYLVFGSVCIAQTIVNPVFDRTDQPSFHIDKIEITNDSTILFCSFTAEAGSWANISSGTYLEDVSTGRRYTILKSDGLPYSPQNRKFIYAEKCKVKLVFPAFLSEGAKFNLIEKTTERAFNIYGINTKESNDSNYNNFSLEQAISLTSKADFYASIENYDKAIEFEKQAKYIKKAKLGRLSEQYEKSVSMLGKYYWNIGDYNKAISYLSEDLELIKEIAGIQYDGYAITMSAIASCLEKLGKYYDAISMYEDVISIIEKNIGKESLDYALAKQSLAMVYDKIGDVPKALQCVEETMDTKKKVLGESHKDYISSLSFLADLYSGTDIRKAYKIGSDVVRLAKKYYGEDHLLYAMAIRYLGIYCAELKKNEEALSYAKKSVEIVQKTVGDKDILYGVTLSTLSQIYFIVDDYDNAIKAGVESLSLFEKNHPQYYQALNRLACFYAGKNDYEQAIKYMNKSIDVIRRDLMPEFNKMEPELRYLWWEKIHTTIDFDYPNYVSNCKNDSTTSDLYNTILFTKGIIAGGDSNYSWQDIKEQLQSNDIAIEFVSAQRNNSFEFYALTLKRDYAAPHMIYLSNSSQILQFFENPENYPETNLNHYIWEPIEEELMGVKKVYFSPTNVLHYFPIEYFPLDDNGDPYYQCDFFRLSSTKELLTPAMPKKVHNAVLYGGLNYGTQDDMYEKVEKMNLRSGFEKLPYSEIEVSDIAQIMRTKNTKVIDYYGYDGTEDTFKQLSGKSIDILHLATHGMYIESEETNNYNKSMRYKFIQINETDMYMSKGLSRSFLVLSGGNRAITGVSVADTEDGIITALEISKMDFKGTDLVVLSACETALGKLGYDDRILGLQQGFKLGGANAILMSLGRVDDEATKILMVEFYKNLMSGKSKHQSLKDAQKYLRQVENGKFNKPEYWASFIMLDGLN